MRGRETRSYSEGVRTCWCVAAAPRCWTCGKQSEGGGRFVLGFASSAGGEVRSFRISSAYLSVYLHCSPSTVCVSF